MNRRTWLRASLLPLAAALQAGCSTPPGAGGQVSAKGPFFYPPPPAAPRIQHLLTLSSARDLAPPRSGFAEFVAGKDTKAMTLMQPYGVALHEGRMYVADTGAPGLAVFDFDKRSLVLKPGSGAGRMKRPINVTIDVDGTRYVTDTANDRVMVYDRDDRFVRAMGSDGQFRPVDVAIDGERLYVVDIAHHQVQVLDKRLGSLIARFGKVGNRSGELFQPTNIAIAPGGDVLVVETGNFRVQRFHPDGTHVRFYGEAGDVPGTFARPKGIAVDREGRIYVTDAAFQNVQIFEASGRLLMDFGRPLDGLDGLNLPAGVRLDYDHVPLFERYAAADFKLEYLVMVVSQFGPNKVDVYGFGRKAGVDYDSPKAGGKR